MNRDRNIRYPETLYEIPNPFEKLEKRKYLKR